ncbi:MAG: hypothetical protein AMXMBFR48_18940 [Ignavibacteriales bacterium]
MLSILVMGAHPADSGQVNARLWFGAIFSMQTAGQFGSGFNADLLSESQTSLSLSETPDSDISINFPFAADSLVTPEISEEPVEEEYPDSLLTDSTQTTLPADTVKVDSMALDSTARIAHFRYKRKDSPYISLYTQKPSRFFTESTSQKKRTVTIDSAGRFVEIKEFIGTQQTKLTLRIPIDEYLSMKMKSRERELWDALAYQYELKDNKKDLAGLIKDFTDFEIPLPSVGVLSIFGAPKISLRIGGAVDIHGAWRNETTEGVTASRLGNTRNEPDFKQQVQINVNGTIGDKLQINADWNTERTFEYENQLKLKYTGYEDEIVQSIEAGNVSLQTSPLVGGSEALFGVKANFKMGPLTLTALASQKKGEVKEKALTGGTSSQDFTIRAHEYSRAHYFVDSIYADTSSNFNLFNKYYANPTPQIDSRYQIKDIEVWKSVGQALFDPTERNVIAYINLPPLASGQVYNDLYRDVEEVNGRIVKGRFIKLVQGKDYTINDGAGFVSFKATPNETDILAVSYSIDGDLEGPSDDQFFGEFLSEATSDTSKRLVLKLIKPQNLQPSNTTAWRLLLKNIYPLGVRNIKKEGFELDIKYEIDGQDPVSILGNTRIMNAFGFDLIDQSSNPGADGLFDFLVGKTVMPETGEIIFPVLQPFGRNIPQNLPNADSLRYLDVYDTTQTIAKYNKLKDKFIITGKVSGEASSNYPLGFNVVENSVRVTLDGRELTAGVDYVVDYNIGNLTIRNSAALVPGANLRITYEENDLFQIASKTLFGMRGIVDVSQKTKFGFSALTLSEQTLSDKVRIGEEPLSNSIYGLDFSTEFDLPFITTLLDNVISTRTPSTMSFRGEFAYMSPDPNTKKSTISSDGGKSIAYIDDFEGAKRIIPVGISYTVWRDLSVPKLYSDVENKLVLERMNYKSKAWWFNFLPSNVVVNQIWPDRKVARGDEAVTVLDYVFVPDTPGTYNYNPDFADKRKSWGGMMKLLSTTANNLVDENIEFIEFWMQIRQAPADGKIYIDLGKISEDVIPNNALNSEDINKNDLIDQGEDTGIDGLVTAAEQTTFGSNRPDPSNDDFGLSLSGKYNIYDYFNINGTEGNAALSDIGRFPDTEDLNRNGNLDQLNNYFRFEIPLDTNRTTNPFVVGGGNNDNWYLFRIPLKDFTDKVGDPSFSVVEYIRLFTTDASDMIHFRMTEFNLVGNQWRKVTVANRPEDSVLSLSVVNIEDNPNYTSPDGVQRERDRSRPDQDILRNEQALSLIIKDLPDGEKREAVKTLTRPLDVFNYSEMKLFIHGEENAIPGSISYSPDETQYEAEVYFQFGSDSNSYYEYRQPVRKGWNEITIKFSELTALKQARDSANIVFRRAVSGKPGHYYQVKGNPTLTQVKFLQVGIYNKFDGPTVGALSGEIWVNELRVIGADETPGWAYSGATSIKFADLMTISFNMAQTNPFFHRLAERFGSRVESVNWGLAADIDVLRLIPVNLPGSTLRLNYSRTESVGKPLYLPATDIKVDEAVRLYRERLIVEEGFSPQQADALARQISIDAQSLSTSDSWSLGTIKLKIPGNYWLIRDTWNALTFGFNYNKSFSRNPSTLASKNWIWNANMNYAITLSPDYFFYPAKIPYLGALIDVFKDYRNAKVYFTPQSFSYNITAKRNKNYSATRLAQAGLSNEAISRDFGTTRGMAVGWKLTENGFFNITTTYNYDAAATLAYLEVDQLNQERSESKIWKDIVTGEFFGRDLTYNQTFDIKTSPRLPSLWDISRYFTVTAGYNARYGWQDDIRQLDLGRSINATGTFNTSLSVKLKALTQTWFEDLDVKPEEKKPTQQVQQTRDRTRDFDKPNTELTFTDTTRTDSTVQDSVLGPPKPSTLANALIFLKATSRFIFFDYENINISFSSGNQMSASGIYGTGTGFRNFFGVKENADEGPGRAFMLGLSNNAGRRAANGNLQDNPSQKYTFDIRTSRPLWEGARIEINWKLGWSTNKNTTLRSDSLGNVRVTNITSTGSINRSFMSIPPVFFLSALNSGIKRVHELYRPTDPNQAQSLSKAFVEGFESLPLLSGLGFLEDVANYIPRPNWRITWDGLEKYSIFSSFTKRVSLDHAYQSDYAEGWKLNPDGTQVTQSQKITLGFQPLLGMNVTFNTLWDGNLSGNVKYSTRSSFDLGVTTKNITEGFSRDIGISLNYSKSGFELPLFGIDLKNDIEFIFSYTNTRSSTIVFDMANFKEEGTPQDGTTRTSLEPRIKYVLSARVTMSIFYKRSSVSPEGAARIPPTTTNEAGIDVRITIQ